MKRLITLAALLMAGSLSWGQPILRNYLTTNPQPFVIQGVIAPGATTSSYPRVVTIPVPAAATPALQFLQPDSGPTNFHIDFGYSGGVLTNATNIYFHFSTNWPASSNFAHTVITIPTNGSARTLNFIGLSTNWYGYWVFPTIPIRAIDAGQLEANAYGQGETNVQLTYHALTPGGSGSLILQGMIFWLDAAVGVYQDLGITPATNGAAVRIWKDKSGNGRDFRADLAGLQPQWTTNRFNGYPGVGSAFAGNLWMTNRDNVQFGQPNWYFMVVCKTNTQNDQIFTSEGGHGNIVDWYAGSFDIASETGLVGWAGGNFGGTPVLISLKYSGTGSIIRTNGLQAVTGNAGTVDARNYNLFNNGAGANALHGALAELMGYSGPLSLEQVSAVEHYLATKYGISIP